LDIGAWGNPNKPLPLNHANALLVWDRPANPSSDATTRLLRHS
jgi:hypothetical protein